MYTIIPIEEIINIITEKREKQIGNTEYVTKIKNTLNTINKKNYFKFDNKLYRQIICFVTFRVEGGFLGSFQLT